MGQAGAESTVIKPVNQARGETFTPRLEEIGFCCGFHDEVHYFTTILKKSHTIVDETSKFQTILSMTRSESGRLTTTDSGRGSLPTINKSK